MYSPEVIPRLAVELLELLEHDSSRRHVDPQREGLGGEHDLHELALEELFDDLFERRQKTRMMRSDSPLKVLAPFPESEDSQILLEQGSGALLDDRPDLRPLLGCREAGSGPANLLHRGIAAGAAEDEEDGGEQIRSREEFDHLGAIEPFDPLCIRRSHRPLTALVGAAMLAVTAATS